MQGREVNLKNGTRAFQDRVRGVWAVCYKEKQQNYISHYKIQRNISLPWIPKITYVCEQLGKNV